MSEKNLQTSFHRLISRESKESLLQQRGLVVWITGLSGSGKTTLAVELEKILFEQGRLTQVLDGDNMRSGVTSGLGFSINDRSENIRRIAEVAKLFKNCGIITICACLSPLNELNDLARAIIGENDFVHVYLNTPLEICEDRDVKGLYAKARRGEILHFTGITSPFEVPSHCDIEINTVHTVENCISNIIEVIFSRINKV